MFRVCHVRFSGISNGVDLSKAYAVLGIPEGSGISQVKAQFITLAKRYHPDLNHGDDTKMKAVNVAYAAVVTNISENGGQSGTAPQQQQGSTAASSQQGVRRKSKTSQSIHRNMKTGQDAWAQSSKFDWFASVGGDLSMGKSQDVIKEPRDHPNSFNKHFPYDTDLEIYNLIRGGSSVSQTARQLGKTPLAIETRLNSNQFKNRVRSSLKKESVKEKPTEGGSKRDRVSTFGSADPRQRVVVRRKVGSFSAPEAEGSDPFVPPLRPQGSGLSRQYGASAVATSFNKVSAEDRFATQNLGSSYTNYARFYKK